jgi:hypothetical protein
MKLVKKYSLSISVIIALIISGLIIPLNKENNTRNNIVISNIKALMQARLINYSETGMETMSNTQQNSFVNIVYTNPHIENIEYYFGNQPFNSSDASVTFIANDAEYNLSYFGFSDGHVTTNPLEKGLSYTATTKYNKILNNAIKQMRESTNVQ